jgi:hypothetical protein
MWNDLYRLTFYRFQPGGNASAHGRFAVCLLSLLSPGRTDTLALENGFRVCAVDLNPYSHDVGEGMVRLMFMVTPAVRFPLCTSRAEFEWHVVMCRSLATYDGSGGCQGFDNLSQNRIVRLKMRRVKSSGAGRRRVFVLPLTGPASRLPDALTFA